ncbi:MAG: translation initiation factor IF-2 [Bacillota bacterium]|nr:MAG: translation initiation factor IF-2 [Bacillota bacterium]
MAENGYENIKKIGKLLSDGEVKSLLESIKKSVGEVKRLKSAIESKNNALISERKEKERKEKEETQAAEFADAADASLDDVLVETPAEEPAEAQSEPAAEPAAEETLAPAEEKPAQSSPAAEEKPAEEPVAEAKPEPKETPKEEPKEPAAKKPEKKEKKIAPQDVIIDSAKKKPVFEDTSSWLRKPEPSEERKPQHKKEVYIPENKRPERGPRKEYVSGDRPRPQGGAGAKPAPRGGVYRPAEPVAIPAQGGKNFGANKKKGEKNYEEKKNNTLSKRALIKQSVSVEDFDEDKSGYRKMRPAKKQKSRQDVGVKIEHAVITTEVIPLKVLSEKIGVSAIEITKKLFKEGIMKTINDSVDFDTAAYIAADLGIELELKMEKTAEDKLSEGFVEDTDDASAVKRPPVVTVMGHVDHGKTSLLDRIRKSSVASGEAGGITQHIGAYQVTVNGKPITFLDTPGHEAFTAMRARGAEATDIAVLVVAADDGIMPQTVEAINHAKAAGVSIIAAVNKIDKPEANIDRVKTQLTENGLVPEEWGGDVMVCPVSAKSGQGMDELLESILLLADVKELKANPDRKAKGVVLEAKLDTSKGPLANVLVQNGTLKVGDPIVIGMVVGKVRAMIDDKGRRITSAGPSVPVSIMGLDDVPAAGDTLYAVSQELTKQVAEERKNKLKSDAVATQKVSLDDVFNRIAEGEMKTLNIIVKADVQGSVEAVKQSLLKLSNEEVKVNVIHAAAGAISETDIMLADSSDAIIIGFNVRPDSNAKTSAEKSGVDIKLYRVIYEAIEDVEKALKGMLAPKYKETYMGKAEVRETFKITGVGMVAGCYVTEGKIVRSGKLRIYRDDVMICEGNVNQLKRFKDDVKEVNQGFECGISIEKFNDVKIGDFIESYVIEEVKA